MNSRMIGKRKRMEEYGVGDTEERCVRADPQRQRDDGDRRKAGGLHQHADAIMQVLSQLFEPPPSPHIARHLFDQSDVAEFPSRGLLGFLKRLTAFHPIANHHLQMAPDLFFQLLFTLFSSPQWKS